MKNHRKHTPEHAWRRSGTRNRWLRSELRAHLLRVLRLAKRAHGCTYGDFSLIHKLRG